MLHTEFDYHRVNIVLVRSYEAAIMTAKTLKSQPLNYSICGIELEFGEKVVTDSTFDVLLNHHECSVDKKIPSISFNEKRCNNILISHIDIDTIFGIGWVSGFFDYHCPKNLVSKLKDLCYEISKVDVKGIHHVDKNYLKEITVFNSIINTTKYKLSRMLLQSVSGLTLLNISTIIISTLQKIISYMMDTRKIDDRYSKIIENITYPELLKDFSCDKIHVYAKKCNDFMHFDNDFIVIKNRSISVYGRNVKIVKKYFPEGLPNYMRKYFSHAGGHFCSAGSDRNKKISDESFLQFITDFQKVVRGA